MTPQQAKQLRDNPIFQAFCEGKEVEFREDGSDIFSITKTIDFELLLINDEGLMPIYRIKPPTPTLRPWKPEEVPVGALARPIQRAYEHTRFMITGVSEHNISLACGNAYELTEFSQQHEHSLDHGKTWLPCGVVE